MKEKTVNRKWQKLKRFGSGVGAGFSLVGLTMTLTAGNVPQGPTRLGLAKSFAEEPHPAPRIQLNIEGEIRDIFGNPRKGVTVIIREMEKKSVTDERGEFHLLNLPDGEGMVLDARYGEERCSRHLEIKKDTETVQEVRTDDVTRKTLRISEPLILENPNIKVDICLCERVEDRTPINRFEEEKLRIPVDMGRIWCFVRVFGPPGYEKDKRTEITYLWYFEGKPIHSYTQEVGFNLSPRGWRTYAFKNLHGRTGTWRLDIEAKHEQLASLSFETY